MPKPTFFKLPEDKRQRVLTAAIDEFASVPFEAASVNRIVRGAGIAKGSFYQYFDDLVDLYRHLIFVVGAEGKLAALRASPPPSGTGLFDQLAHTAHVSLRWAMSEPRLSAASRSLRYPAGPDSPLRSLQEEGRAAALASFTAMIEQGIRSGAVRSDVDVPAAATMLLVSLQEGLDTLVTQRFGFDIVTLCSQPSLSDTVDSDAIDEVVDALIDTLRAGIGGDPDAGELDLDAVMEHYRENT